MWTWGDGQSLTFIPVMSPVGKVPFLAVPFAGVTGDVKVVAYDASGKALGELPVAKALKDAETAQADHLAVVKAASSTTPTR